MVEGRHVWLLRACLGADHVGHSGRSLFDHLVGTFDLLRAWGASRDVALAGLFHSIYGTKTFRHQCVEPTVENRDLIAHFIGERAELLAYIFCTSKRSGFLEMGHHEASQDLKDLLEIEAANLLEQGSRGKALWRLAHHPGISDNARAALRQALTDGQAEGQVGEKGTKRDRTA